MLSGNMVCSWDHLCVCALFTLKFVGLVIFLKKKKDVYCKILNIVTADEWPLMPPCVSGRGRSRGIQ